MKSILIIFAILIAYIQQMAPAPLLSILRESFYIGNNDALLYLSVSIIYPMIIISSLIGSRIEQKKGTVILFQWTLFFLAFGILLNYVAVSYCIFLLGRAVLGIGFGLGIPFIGSAIMKWYTPKQRELMNTVNGLFPFFGTVMSYSLIIPLYGFFDNSWKNALGIWGFGIVVVGILWVFLTKKSMIAGDVINEGKAEKYQIKEKSVYLNLWRRREIKLLCASFGCDYFLLFLYQCCSAYPIIGKRADDRSCGRFGGCSRFSCCWNSGMRIRWCCDNCYRETKTDYGLGTDH